MSEHQNWIGRQDFADDVISPSKVAALAATLDLDPQTFGTGDPLPMTWIWAFCTPAAPTRALDADGHEERGRFLPPIGLPRRMWAGGRLESHAPLFIGAPARRESTILDITEKQGRTGKLVFVLVEHRIISGDTLCIREEQDIVYREAAQPGAAATPKSAPTNADFTETIKPNSNLLFRYSALTFNAHKIHLDRDYACDVEGYPGLVVHGPLIATLLLDIARRHFSDRQFDKFSFRAIGPLFDTGPFTVSGRMTDENALDLWAASDSGALATEACAQFS